MAERSLPEPSPPPKTKPKVEDEPDQDADLREAPPVQSGEALIYGVEHDSDRIYACYILSAAMAVTALFGVAPSLYQGALFFFATERSSLETWAFVLSAACGMQLAYAVYLLQAPDWLTAKISAYVMVILATLYAAMLGAIVFSPGTGAVVRYLQIYSYHADHRAAGWCFIMLLLTGMIAFFGGRFAVSWQEEDTELEI